jgi:mono/diheme cytochrome c family protein
MCARAFGVTLRFSLRRSSMNLRISICLAVFTAGAYSVAWADDAKPYRIVDGKVDDATYRGWRAYHSSCHTCHGVDAVGTNIAPSLVDRVARMSARQFTNKVLTSYRITLPAGEATGDDPTAVRSAIVDEVLRRERGELVMPAWEGDTKVRPHVLDLYAYLRARADGALGPGKPQRINDKVKP